MAKYILQSDAVRAIGADCEGNQRTGQAKMTVFEARSRIEAMKGVDAIPAETIVHCGKCKWYCFGARRCLHPTGIINPPIGPMFYCKNGEALRNGKAN